MKWFATGGQTFMMKEVLMHKLQGFLQIVSANEQLTKYTDMRELLEQVWAAGQIGKESPVYDEETVQKNAQNDPMQHAQQAIQEIEQKAGDLIKQAQAQTQQAQQQLADAKRMEQFKLAELQSKEKLAMFELINKLSQAGHESHLTEAQIDLLQAQTVKTLEEAKVIPSQQLLDEAKDAESDGKTGNDNESASNAAARMASAATDSSGSASGVSL
jgi:hypothetical protein